MKKLILAALFLVGGLMAYAQQEPHFTMYMFNKQVINPAFAGSRELASLNLFYRKQWAGLNGSPESINGGIHSPLGGGNRNIPSSGVGLWVMNDVLGVESHLKLFGQYAYRIMLSDEGDILSMGIQGGFNSYSADLSQLNGNISGAMGIDNAILPNVGAGLYYYRKPHLVYGPKVYAGVSVPFLLQPKLASGSSAFTINSLAREYRHYYGMAGVLVDVAENFKLKPNIMVKYTGVLEEADGAVIESPLDMDFNIQGFYSDKLMIGLSYRLDDSFDAMAMVFLNKLRIGYAYDLTVSELSKYNNGSHELMLGFDFKGLTIFDDTQNNRTKNSPRF